MKELLYDYTKWLVSELEAKICMFLFFFFWKVGWWCLFAFLFLFPHSTKK